MYTRVDTGTYYTYICVEHMRSRACVCVCMCIYTCGETCYCKLWLLVLLFLLLLLCLRKYLSDCVVVFVGLCARVCLHHADPNTAWSTGSKASVASYGMRYSHKCHVNKKKRQTTYNIAQSSVFHSQYFMYLFSPLFLIHAPQTRVLSSNYCSFFF